MNSRYVRYENQFQNEPANLTRVGVVGTREAAPDAYAEVKRVLDTYRQEAPIIIVTGGARGYDSLGMRYAAENHLPCDVYWPLWEQFGRRAGFMRNRDIVEHSDIIFAWPGIGGRGTQLTISLAHELGVDIIVRQVERWL